MTLNPNGSKDIAIQLLWKDEYIKTNNTFIIY